MKKAICSSNLILRFYQADGWTKEELDAYCLRGEVKCYHPEDQFPYFTLNHNLSSYFDCAKLYEEKCSELKRTFNDYPNESDVQFMERLNG